MASRTMHLAIADKLIQRLDIDNEGRFRLGSILPDAYHIGMGTAVSHFKTKILNGTKSTYRLADFRREYDGKMFCDSLYLGYYMHLIQDMLFRQFIYDVHKWDPSPNGNVDRLHNDYRLLNTYIIEKYNISSGLDIPDDIFNEAIMHVYPFDLIQLKKDFINDRVPYTEGSVFFFTEEMADEFIISAADKCEKEIKALENGGYIIDETEYAWDVHT